MLRKLNIGNRLITGFALVLVCSVTISIIAILEINKIFNDTRSLYERPFLVSKYLREIKINALNIRRYMLDIMLLEDKQEIDRMIAEINNEEQQALQKFRLAEGIYFGNKQDLNESFNFFRDYKSIRDEVINMKIEGGSDIASEIISTRNRNYVAELFDKMQAALDNTEREADIFYQSALETKEKVIIKLLIILIVMFIISIAVASLITRSIVNPLSEVVEKIREIAKGILGNTRLPEREDEIGRLALSYNEMQENLLRKTLTAQKIAEGDFSARALPGSDKDILADSINRIAANFDLVVQQARKVAEGDYGNLAFSFSGNNQLVRVISDMLDSLKGVVDKAKQVADGDYSGVILPKSKSDELALALNKMTKSLREVTEINASQSRLKSAQNELNDRMRGDLTVKEISENILSYAAAYTNSQAGVLYIFNDTQKCFEVSGGYAISDDNVLNRRYKPGESLVGQAAVEKTTRVYTDLPEDFLRITSGMMDVRPRNVLVSPLIFNNLVTGVMELCSLYDYNSECIEFLQLANESMAVSIMSVMNRVKLTNLLEVTTSQAEELQIQQEELREINEELESQTSALRISEEYLKSQQEELRVTNEELEEKTERLQKSTALMEEQNRELEIARHNLEIKAGELEASGRYKSEFLANMSHELRTPLNSLLILAQNLAENKSANLSEQQVEAARIIWNSGNDLLNLINEILDLSKIESGKMSVSFAPYRISELENSIRSYFSHITTEKKLELEISIPEDFTVHTDEQRLNQIMRNLLSNAIKFTEKGGIYISIYKPGKVNDLDLPELKKEEIFAISVRDTGIGIPAERQHEIFDAFQQVDGSISRKYGGTGLGLSITRELTKLLGGEIKLKSEKSRGSEFIIYLPVNSQEQIPAPDMVQERPAADISFKKIPEPVRINDDRDHFSNGEPGILIIDDDQAFASVIGKMCTGKGLKFLYASTGEEGINLATKYSPKGIILDIKLPGIDGWEVLDQLKSSPLTRHIPVHVITVMDEISDEKGRGAWKLLRKPVTRESLEGALNEFKLYIDNKRKRLLIVEDDMNTRKSTKMLLKGQNIQINECGTAADAFQKIISRKYDCLVLDLGLPDMSGLDLLRRLKSEKVTIPPVIIYTGQELGAEEYSQVQQFTQSIIIKGAKSEARLLDETSLFLHRVIDEMPEYQRKMMVNLYNKNELFWNKSVLIVDDDMRNVFALTKVLESAGMKVNVAVNGRKALEFLENNETDLVLMDIMMPVMDGYEAIKQIRLNRKYENLPIIALTAKAMKEDRARSIAAGANDYLSKPVDIHRLFNLMRIWLYR